MNKFCIECVSGKKQHTANAKEQVKACDDKKCPFYHHRKANLDWQEGEHD